jgi:hypothetical protein
MNWRKDDPGERETPRGYHHGNLRATLVRAALELIVAPRDSEQFAAALAPGAGTTDAPTNSSRCRSHLSPSRSKPTVRRFEDRE